MLKSGDIIGSDYQIIEEIGNGGMGKVFKAHDLKNGGYSAVKKLEGSADFSLDQNLIFFKREADMLREVKGNDCFPQFKDYILDNNNYYIVMEYIEGDNLENILKIRDLSEEEIKDYVLQILDALEILHSKGIIYRDMKPANIIITNDNKVILCDFGIARYLKDQKITKAETAKISSTQVGTLEFASPEHYGGLCDERSDLYCLARTIYFCFTKTFDTLFPMKENIELLTISKSFTGFLIRALEFNKQDRFQDVDEMRKALKKVKFDKKNGAAKNVAPVNTNVAVNQLISSQKKCPSWHISIEAMFACILLIGLFLTAAIDSVFYFLCSDVWLFVGYFGGVVLISALLINALFRGSSVNYEICCFHWTLNVVRNLFGKIGSIFGFLFGPFRFLKKVNFGGWKDAVRFWGSYSLPIVFLVNWFSWWTIGKVFYFTQVMNWFWIASIGMSIFLIWFIIYRCINDEPWSGWTFFILIFYWIIGGAIYNANFCQKYMEKGEFCLATQYEEVEGGAKYVNVIDADKPFSVSWSKYHKDDRIFIFYNGDKIELSSCAENELEGQIKLCLSETTILKFLIVCKERGIIIRNEFVINVRNGKDTLDLTDLTQDNKDENKNQDNIIDLTNKKIYSAFNMAEFFI